MNYHVKVSSDKRNELGEIIFPSLSEAEKAGIRLHDLAVIRDPYVAIGLVVLIMSVLIACTKILHSRSREKAYMNVGDLYGTRLVMELEIPDDVDKEKAFARLATLPRQQEWEEYVGKCQVCNPDDSSAEKWHSMEKIFGLPLWLSFGAPKKDGMNASKRKRTLKIQKYGRFLRFNGI